MEPKTNEFKASSVDAAIQLGLEQLGLTEEEADIEVVAKGGIFSKAVVRITPKTVAEEPVAPAEKEEEIVVDAVVEEPIQKEASEKPEEKIIPMEVLKAKLEEGKAFLDGLLLAYGGAVGLEAKIRDGELNYYVNGEDAGNFIGYKGETLDAVQTLVRHYINQNTDDLIGVVVDADFYRERRKKTLIAMAKRVATQAFNQHREIALEPMNSYERLIIHAALQNSLEAETRSEGEGKDRHVIICPKNGTMSYGDSGFKRKGPGHTKTYGGNKRKF